MDINIRTGDAFVLIAYLVAMVWVGIYFSRKNKTTEDYFLGGRNFPGWAIGISLIGTSISSISFLGYPAQGYKGAYLLLLTAFTLPIAVYCGSRYFLQFYRRAKVTSAFEYLEGRFGPVTRVYGAFAFIISQYVRVSIVMYLVSRLLTEMTGMDPVLSVLAGAVIVSFYTVIGGIEAVIWTDVVQTIILVFGGILCLGVIVWKLPGGLEQIFAVGAEAGKFQFAELIAEGEMKGQFAAAKWYPSISEKTALMLLFVGLTSWMYEYSCNQNVVQRYCATKSAREARKAMWVCCGLSIPIWVFFTFLGTALFVFYQHFPSTEAANMLIGAEGAKAENILPYFVLNELPVFVAGIVIAAIMAAAMSSLDSSINAISTVGIIDIYKRHIRKGAPDKHYLNVAKVIAVFSSIVMVCGAIALTKSDSKTLLDSATVLAALTTGGLLGIYMLGFFTKRGDDRSMTIAIVATLFYSLYRAVANFDWYPDALKIAFLDYADGYYTAIIGNLFIFIFAYILALLIPAGERSLRNLTVYTQDDEALQ